MTHRYCPMIEQNCCTPDDEIKSLVYWNTIDKVTLENRYKSFLYMLKYLLGYMNEGTLLAESLRDHKNKDCFNASKDFKAVGYNSKISKEIYQTIETAIFDLADLRKGVYCMACDANTIDHLKNFWHTQNEFYKKRFYYSKSFCEKLVRTTIKSSFYLLKYVKNYLENMVQLISCTDESHTKLIYDLNLDDYKITRNCFFFKENFFYFFCEKYCENFNILEFSSILEGNLRSLQ